MNPYLPFVRSFAAGYDQGLTIPLGGFPATRRPVASGPCVALFAPHPDDECLQGGLALRLQRQSGWRAVNVPVTFGSNPQRKQGRLKELTDAIEFLGFGMRPLAELGLDRVTAAAREREPEHWASCVRAAQAALEELKPALIVCPHEADWNGTHIGTHLLVLDALALMPPDFTCRVAFSEFWGTLYAPNLMVELSIEDVADLVAATSFHVKEVERNPYHLRLPAQLMDNVRRGGETVGGQGGAAPRFHFAMLYLLKEWKGGRLLDVGPGGRFLSRDADPTAVMK